MTIRVVAALSIFALISACATISRSTGGVETAQPVNLASADAGVQGLQPLADAAIPSSECGMVLWTLEGRRPAAVFRFVSGKQAQINIAGKPVNLTRTDYDGASGYGVFERQVFESGDGVAVEVTARFGLSFDGGAYLEQGLIKVRDAAGWSMVSPTAGIAGCRR